MTDSTTSEVIEVLRPFEKLACRLDDFGDEYVVIRTGSRLGERAQLTVGHLRAARALLSRIEAGQSMGAPLLATSSTEDDASLTAACEGPPANSDWIPVTPTSPLPDDLQMGDEIEACGIRARINVMFITAAGNRLYGTPKIVPVHGVNITAYRRTTRQPQGGEGK